MPPGPHLVGANGKTTPAWGFRQFSICFSGQSFKLNFLFAAMATPLLGSFTHSSWWVIWTSRATPPRGCSDPWYPGTSTNRFLTTCTPIASSPPACQERILQRHHRLGKGLPALPVGQNPPPHTVLPQHRLVGDIIILKSAA